MQYFMTLPAKLQDYYEDGCIPTVNLNIIIINNWSTDVFFLLFFQSFCSHTESTMKFGSWPFVWDLRFLLPFLWARYIIFQGIFRLPN